MVILSWRPAARNFYFLKADRSTSFFWTKTNHRKKRKKNRLSLIGLSRRYTCNNGSRPRPSSLTYYRNQPSVNHI
jgi:hypothetical protein